MSFCQIVGLIFSFSKTKQLSIGILSFVCVFHIDLFIILLYQWIGQLRPSSTL
eukprot:UN21096